MIICLRFIGGGSLLRLTWTMPTATWLNWFLSIVHCSRWIASAPVYQLRSWCPRAGVLLQTIQGGAQWLGSQLPWNGKTSLGNLVTRPMQRTLDGHEKGSLHKGRISGGEQPLLVFSSVNPTSLWRFWQVVSLPMHAQVLLFAQPFGLALYDWQLICQVFLLLEAVGSFMWFLFFFDQA